MILKSRRLEYSNKGSNKLRKRISNQRLRLYNLNLQLISPPDRLFK